VLNALADEARFVERDSSFDLVVSLTDDGTRP